MTTSVSGRLNILCIVFKIIAFFMITLFARLYEMVGILLTYGKRLHDHIISRRVDVWAYKASLNSPCFIEVPMPSQESEWPCICVLLVMYLCVSGIGFASFNDFNI